MDDAYITGELESDTFWQGEQSKIEILNRIDEEVGCSQIIVDREDTGVDYCEMPEWNPFSVRCWHHTPGNA